jgi:hypothetical protein
MDLKMDNLKNHQIKLISIASRMQLDTRQQPVWLEVELQQVLEAQQLYQQLVSHQEELQQEPLLPQLNQRWWQLRQDQFLHTFNQPELWQLEFLELHFGL